MSVFHVNFGIPVLLFSIMLLGLSAAIPAVSEDFSPCQLEWETQITKSGDSAPVPYPSQNPNGVVIGVPGRIARLDGKGKILFDVIVGEGGDQSTHGTNHFNASVADLDGDGVEEIIAGSGRTVLALDGRDGSALWEFDLGTGLGQFHYAVTADLDADGLPEILISNRLGWLYCISGKGELIWRHRLEPYQLSMTAVGDIDNDGEPEIVYGTANHHLIAIDRNGHVEWDTRIDPLNMWRTYPLIADTNADGMAEVYSMCARRSDGTGLAAVNGKDGRLLWEGVMTHKAYCALAAADLDGDGQQEILAGDKGTTLACFDSNGTMRWRSFLKGRGIWTRPSVADVNGDGSYEIIVTVRDQSSLGHSWYILNSNGDVLGSYAQEGGCFGEPLVADIDGDGQLEVVINSRNGGRVKAYSFGGASKPNSVLITGWQGNPYPLRKEGGKESPVSEPSHYDFVKKPEAPCLGNCNLTATLPKGETRRVLELQSMEPSGTTTVTVCRIEAGQVEAGLPWQVAEAGKYELSLRLYDLDSHQSIAVQTLKVDVSDPLAELTKLEKETVEAIRQKAQGLQGEAPDTATLLEQRALNLAGEFNTLKQRAENTAKHGTIEQDQICELADKFQQRVQVESNLTALAATRAQDGAHSPFVLWEDANPWDNVDPMTELPEHGGPVDVSIWALGNEAESAVVNVLNLSPRGLTLRVDPGIVKAVNGGDMGYAAYQLVEFRRVVHLPSRFGEVVGDVLPHIAEGYLIDVAPGEVQQLWLTVLTKDLKAGRYDFSWNVRVLDAGSATAPLNLHLDVASVSLPEKGRYAANFWSQNSLGDINTIPDLNRIGQNVWYRMPLPRGEVNAQGEMVGEIDWSAHDAILNDAKYVKMILYSGGAPTPAFPKDVEVTDELRLKAQRAYAKVLVAHLRTLGLDYENFCFYPEDEPGLVGVVDSYIEKAKAVKNVDPDYQVYANPYGMITIEMIKEMEPYTDVWQPGLETVENLGHDYVKAMKGPKGDKLVWTYTPPDNVRVLKPFRILPGHALADFLL